MNNRQLIETTFNASLETIENALRTIPESLDRAIESAALAIGNGGKICFAGNGGSASDSLHIAGELVGFFDGNEIPLPAISFSADMAVMTSIANDLSIDKIFLQQARGLLRQGDLFWVISTSGNSKNLTEAVEWANKN
ncbi:MAG: SIS domain-containing protein, partial [bacterium]